MIKEREIQGVRMTKGSISKYRGDVIESFIKIETKSMR